MSTEGAGGGRAGRERPTRAQAASRGERTARAERSARAESSARGESTRPARLAHEGPSFLAMIGFVAAIVALVIVVFFVFGYILGRIFL